MLLHGSTTTAHSWDAIAPRLADRFRVIALDLRNHGESDRGAFGSRAVVAGDLAAIVDVLGLETFGLVGHSAGGGAALVYAVSHPDRLTHLVIEDIGPVAPRGSRALRGARRHSGPLEFESFARLCAWMRKIRPHATDDWIESQARLSSVVLPDGRCQTKYTAAPIDDKSPPNADLWPLLPRVTCPTLLLRAEESAIFPEADAARMLEILPDARVVVVPNAGHMAHEDNPGFVGEVIAQFFGVPAGSAHLEAAGVDGAA